MSDYKFGTWYPIKHIKKDSKWKRVNVLLSDDYDVENIFIGFIGSSNYEKNRGVLGFVYREPTHFMPLPSLPGEADDI